MKKTFIIILLFLSINSLYSQNSQIVGYLPTYRFQDSDKIDFCKLTHVNICFANPNSKGQILEIDSLAKMLLTIRESNPQIKINLSLAGGALLKEQAYIWRKYVDIPQNRPILIKSIMKYVEKYNFDGVDMDLEWKNVTKGYSPFVIALKKELVLEGKAFTAALPAILRYKNITDEALETFDYINIMAYDERGSWAPKDAGPHSSYEFAEKSIYYWRDLVGVPAHKLTLGLPFYGYDFTNTRRTKSFKIKEIVAMNADNLYTDSVGLIFYNGIPTIKKKVGLATENIAGVMIWELGQDSTKEFSLLSAVHSEIVKLGANTTISTCDIPKEIIEKNELEVFKEKIVFNTVEDERLFSITSENISDIKVEVYNERNRKIRLITIKENNTRYYRTRKLWKGTFTLIISNKKYHFKKKLIIEKRRKKKRKRNKK